MRVALILCCAFPHPEWGKLIYVTPRVCDIHCALFWDSQIWVGPPDTPVQDAEMVDVLME